MQVQLRPKLESNRPMRTSTQANPATNTRTIARNSIWYGAETGFLFLTTLVTSIAMARVIGPEKLGYFNYVMWLANTTGLVGSLGVPTTTSKYMAEYLGRGEAATTRAIFNFTMKLQAVMAACVTGGALIVLYVFGDPVNRTVSAFQVASVLPAMLTLVPAQANAARENLKANTIASFVGNIIFTISIISSLVLGWGLLGIAIGILVFRTVELGVRLVPVWRWIGRLPVGTVPADLKRRMMRFSGNNVVLMLLNLIVWDRSDVVLLKFLSPDIAQISFFAVGFNLVEKALIVPQTIAGSINVTINAQYGRDRSRLNTLVSSSAKYLLLFSAPLLLGLAAISSPAISVAYGWQYIPAIPVLAVAALMALPKPLLLPAQQMLQANEQQKFLIVWGITCGLLNIGLDWMLIPKMGALGAAIGNGAAQLLGVIGPWIELRRRFAVHVAKAPLLKISIAAVLMAASVVGLHQVVSPVLTLAIGIPGGAIIFLICLRLFRTLGDEDVARLRQFTSFVPPRFRSGYSRGVTWISGLEQPEISL